MVDQQLGCHPKGYTWKFVVRNVRSYVYCAWAQRWTSTDRFLIEGFSLHRDRPDLPDRLSDAGLVKYGDPVQVEAGLGEDFDKTFHYGLLEARRVLVNPPEVVLILREAGMTWDQVVDVGDGRWYGPGPRRGILHPNRWKAERADPGALQFSSEADLLKRLRKECGQTVVKVVNVEGNELGDGSVRPYAGTSQIQVLFARPTFDELVAELLVLRVMYV